ncbi:SusC/RagA family TonB-linked outer membrane protein [Marinoscillum furvescens]|uniref:TonB-linked SusC/RagA family outer membrane protein n=1 Tax=Marinoscillum furvescens DSM 4134 TaxID=1122208 RepID=A0A3D9L097_MARFU|nr:TonB-dependent receptor [Marinoscillum furvescens]RED96599.1 TonB-linked SusC/RagA family outer membrane protein [Marinoscillum furvescens DSM 4134]
MKQKLLATSQWKSMFMAGLLGCLAFLAKAQDAQIVSGQITSEEGDGLPGVTVIVQGSTQGTVTDIDGNFRIQAEDDDVLICSFIGFQTVEVPVNNRSVIDITMEEDLTELEEVVVIGYGTQKKSHLTGSISKVKGERLEQLPVSRVDDALVGQVSGVNIQATDASAGAAPTITVRGFGSVTADSGPAIVVDGVIVDADFLGTMDMNNVESFEVLKDAASAAIYGSEGSNGVILITTKSGQAGKTKMSYQTFIGFKEAFGSEAYKKDLYAWAAKEEAEEGALSDGTQQALALSEALGGYNKDWQDIFFDGGTIQSHSFSARGGNATTDFSASLRYVHDEGVVLTDDYKLYTADLKLNTKLTKDLKWGLSMTPSYRKRRQLPTSVHNPIRQSPWLPKYHTEASLAFVNQDDPDDNYYFPDLKPGDYFREQHLMNEDYDGDGTRGRARTSGDSNPYAQYVEREHYEYTTNLLGSTYLKWEIIPGLTAQTRFAATLENRKRTRYDGTKHHAAGNSRAEYSLQNRIRTRLISDNTLMYNKKLDKHDFGGMLGLTVQRRGAENSVVEANGYTNDRLKNLEGATQIGSFTETNIVRKKIGYFARINYAFNDKYLFNASFRRDGSSVFGVDSKWGNFPAVSVGWNAHNETFISNTIGDVLSTLKFRASYGRTGAENFDVGDDIVDTWPYLALLNSSNAIVNGAVVPGVSPRNIANTLLQWEASEELTVGLDFGVLSDRISGSVDYYQRVSDNLLLENPVSYVTGFTSGIVNLGEVENEGLEFELRTNNIVKSNFSWNTTVVASTNENTLTAFGDSDGALLEDSYGRNSQWINQVGSPISSFYGYVVDRTKEVPRQYINSPWFPINGQPEDAIVVDLNGDGIITDADKTILGDPYPDLVWSVTNNFKLGNFDLSVMIQGANGYEVKNIGDQYFYTWWQGATTSPAQLVEDGIIPHTSFLKEKVLTDQVVQDASYFSLRNVTVGYNMPNALTSRLGLTDLRIYASGQNLIYKTSDEYNGFNPEFVDNDDNPRKYGEQRAGTPLFRTITLGLNVNF